MFEMYPLDFMRVCASVRCWLSDEGCVGFHKKSRV